MNGIVPTYSRVTNRDTSELDCPPSTATCSAPPAEPSEGRVDAYGPRHSARAAGELRSEAPRLRYGGALSSFLFLAALRRYSSYPPSSGNWTQKKSALLQRLKIVYATLAGVGRL